MLTSVGAKTGKLRKTPLMRVEPDGVYVASLGGAPKHPVRYHNLKKNPEVELQDHATKRDYVAREVTGDEKRLWWERAVETWPDCATYQTNSGRSRCSCSKRLTDEDRTWHPSNRGQRHRELVPRRGVRRRGQPPSWTAQEPPQGEPTV